MARIFLALCILALACSITMAEDVCTAPLDICIALDESGSVGSSNFNTMRTFTKNVAAQFNIGSGSDESRFAIVTFNSNSYLELSLAQGTSLSAVNTEVDSISYNGGGTNNP